MYKKWYTKSNVSNLQVFIILLLKVFLSTSRRIYYATNSKHFMTLAFRHTDEKFCL